MKSPPSVRWFSPQPTPEEIPARLNSPFDTEQVAPLAKRAATILMAELGHGAIGSGLSTSALHGPQGGKMFGVLVVQAPDGHVGFLQAFSGQIQGHWELEGYAPPVFDRALRAQVEPPGEKQVKQLTTQVLAAASEPSFLRLSEELGRLKQQHATQERALKSELEAKQQRREALRDTPSFSESDRRALQLESKRDDSGLRAARAEFRALEEALERELKPFARRLQALERLRKIVSREVSWQLYDCYLFENPAGHKRTLRSLFDPKVPSSGTGDCAAPKLLTLARKLSLKPLALAEFWWGAPPLGGARVEGGFYPACRDKCGTLLPFLLQGVEVAKSSRHRPPERSFDSLKLLYQDESLVVVEKPEGLLSVPGTDASVTDSVWARIRQMFPKAEGPLIVHRLDLETSGLMVLALTSQAHRNLQRQFHERTLTKEYVAVLEGLLPDEAGRIELPLRVDLEQRPRQVVCYEHGKPASTRWEKLDQRLNRTRVRFFPLTGRTHQLRVHASHPNGLGIPIVGDRLYGRPDSRLLLHARGLELTHPLSGERLQFLSESPF